MSAQANCPACGSIVTFGIGSSLAVVCISCRSIVARTDRALQSLGKIAELSESRSPLKLGLRGRYRDQPFTLVGRAQLNHLAGGVWDEWYAAFGSGGWGWIAEAMGRFFITFPSSVPEGSRLPDFAQLRIGAYYQVLGKAPVVAEKGIAEYAAAEGELPFQLMSGMRYPYADLSGPNGQYGTLDFSDATPALFSGHEVTLADLGLAEAAAKAAQVKTVSAVKVACPHCAGALELRAPDLTERVACPYCGSLLDANQGHLVYLKTLAPQRRAPLLPLGASAEFEGQPFVVIGFVTRACHVEGTWYPWDEYLLYHSKLGYRWLVDSDGHWTWVRSIPPGEVSVGGTARCRGRTFKPFQDAPARVLAVRGEFYWKVEAGEMVETSDFVSAPHILSRESSRYETPPEWGHKADATLGEVNWALGDYVPVAEIRRKFPKVQIPDPRGVGPCQPFPHHSVYRYWGWLTLAAALLTIVIGLASPSREVLQRSFQFPPLERSEGAQVLFAEPFELKSGQNILIEASCAVDNSWFFAQGELVDSSSEATQAEFALPIEYYHGVEDGEAWSEGSRTAEEHLSAPAAGKYTLRLEASWEKWQTPAVLNLHIRQGVPRMLYPILILVALSIIPVVVFLRERNFETRRWQESMYGS